MTSSDIAISVSDVSKSYRLEGEGAKASKTMQALQGISFNVARGEGVAIVGRNGAGKSTLLRVVCGITEPDSGAVEVNGKLFPVFGMQAGFDPTLTGLENVRNKAAIMGMRNIDDRLEDIVRFANIGAHIHEPLRTYSNGMRGRLAFAVTFALDPEILVVDETLAAGDTAFHKKCMDRIGEIRESGATLLIVSHGLPLVQRLCDRALLLDGGELLLDAEPAVVNKKYTELLHADPVEAERLRAALKDEHVEPAGDGSLEEDATTARVYRAVPEYRRDADAEIRELVLRRADTQDASGRSVLLSFEVVVRREISNAAVRVRLLSDSGVQVASRKVRLVKGDGKFVDIGDRFRVEMDLLDVFGEGRFIAETVVSAEVEGHEIVLNKSDHELFIEGASIGDPFAPVEISLGINSEHVVRN